MPWSAALAPRVCTPWCPRRHFTGHRLVAVPWGDGLRDKFWMDLRTFRRNGPGLAECESQAAWRRLWADRRAHRSRDTRGPVSNVAASWPNVDTGGPILPPHEPRSHRGLERRRCLSRWCIEMAAADGVITPTGRSRGTSGSSAGPERHGRTTHFSLFQPLDPSGAGSLLDVQRFRRLTWGAGRGLHVSRHRASCRAAYAGSRGVALPTMPFCPITIRMGPSPPDSTRACIASVVGWAG